MPKFPALAYKLGYAPVRNMVARFGLETRNFGGDA